MVFVWRVGFSNTLMPVMPQNSTDFSWPTRRQGPPMGTWAPYGSHRGCVGCFRCPWPASSTKMWEQQPNKNARSLGPRERLMILDEFFQKGTLSVPTFLSPHVSQFPRFHMSGQTTWQITYESLLGKMLRLRNSCLWICSVTNKQTWGTPDSDYISNSQERKSHTENKRKKK